MTLNAVAGPAEAHSAWPPGPVWPEVFQELACAPGGFPRDGVRGHGQFLPGGPSRVVGEGGESCQVPPFLR